MKYKKKIIILVVSLVTLLAAQLAINTIPNQLPNTSRAIIFIASVIGAIIFVNFEHVKHLPRNAFVIILFLGIGISIIKPIQFGLDEETHLTWAIRLADGQLFARETMVQPDWNTVERYDSLRKPNAVHTKNGFSREFLNEKHEPSTYSGKITGVNNIGEIPNALGWAVGRLVSSRIFVSYYLGRIFNVLAYALMAFLALKLGKKYREVIFLFAVFPTNLWIIAGFQYDWLYYGLSMLIIGLLTRFFSDEKVSRKNLSLYLLATTLMIFPKFPYVLMGILPLFISKDKFVKAKDKLFYGLATLGSFLIAVLWYVSPKLIRHFSQATVESKPTVITNAVDATYFIKHPFPIIRTFINDGLGSLSNFSGSDISKNPPAPLYYAQHGSQIVNAMLPLVFVVLLVLATVRLDFQVSKKIKLVFIGIYMIISFLVIYAMAGDNRVGFNAGDLYIKGVQFRYFYLMLMTLPIIFGDGLRKLFPVNYHDSETADLAVSQHLQISLFYINVFIMSVAIYVLIS
ncbi:DUF2142 domain-containing protein [Lactococcus fujiensis]|uniref:DUF2142 domain-containing protein n=1 Tax=Lactococcus fujiensis JCM 16395 TaxID=1291764 RepID=A0A2A5RLH8_9LACT|nr:DUF2142 domain-containing protein [Lactococcus fujiensis]PCS00108.1 hypothetical protein RT41_GL001419 [Lactococcus fujiensis JCM 16395]